MYLKILDSENADLNIYASAATVLTDTPDATYHRLCQAAVFLGDGTKDLDGTGGDFEVTITVDGNTVQPAAQAVTFGTQARAVFWSTAFPVPPAAEVVVKVKSPNAADTDVDVTAKLYAQDEATLCGIEDAPVTILDFGILLAAIISGGDSDLAQHIDDWQNAGRLDTILDAAAAAAAAAASAAAEKTGYKLASDGADQINVGGSVNMRQAIGTLLDSQAGKTVVATAAGTCTIYQHNDPTTAAIVADVGAGIRTVTSLAVRA